MAKGMIQIAEDRCKGCGLCLDVCPPGMLRLSTTRFNAKGYRPVEQTDPPRCTGCTVCAIVCPDVVFTVYRETRRKKEKAAPAA